MLTRDTKFYVLPWT